MITCWQDIEERGGEDWLTPAEWKLVKACKAGEACVLGDGELPPEGAADPERRVRAEVLRYLILGGCDDCRVQGWGVWLTGALVDGHLDLSFLSAKGVTGLHACRFEQAIVALQARFEFLNLNGSHLPGLNAQGAQVTGPVFLRSVTATGEVSLSGASIGGQFHCGGARFTAAEGDMALNTQGATVTDAVFLRGVTATGEVSLVGANIGGQLSCVGARFTRAEGSKALNAQGAQVTDAVFLRGVTATGEVSLSGASIGGQLSCVGAHFTAAEGGMALNAQGATVTDTAFLRGVTATGEVRLSGASIGGQLSCVGADFTATEGGMALNAQGAQVTGDVFLRGITAIGEVSLSGTSIGGQLDCEGARFTGSEGGDALNALRLRVTESLFWRRVTVEAGSVDLSAAHVGDLVDDPDCWPERERLILDGFTYDQISGSATPTDANTRLRWLAKGDSWNGTFFPQPYSQLAKVLHEMGHDRDARKVLARRERKIQADMRKRLLVVLDGSWRAGLRSVAHDLLRAALWLWDILLRGVVGYGHHPFRTILWLLGFWIIATGLSNRAWEAGDFAPNSGPVQVSQAWQAVAATADNPAALWASETEPGRDWETFNRYAYAADLVIPIIDLGQTDAWAPSTSRGDWGRRLWRYGFLLQIAGWIVTALGAAAITGIIRRE